MPPNEQIKPLVDRARRGDREALAALFDLFYDGVYRFAFVRLGSAADAEEAAQETFVQMVRSIKKFRWQGAEFAAWLFRIARNVVVGEQRTRIRRREDLTAAPDTGAVAESAEDVAVGRASSAEIHRLLATLPEEQRRVIELRFTSGLSADEIAAVLGKSAGAVRIQQMRGLQTIRRQMEVTR